MHDLKINTRAEMTASSVSKLYQHGLVWLRRDLRLDDNTALAHALANCKKISIAFIFDRDILDSLPKADRRVEFIWQSVSELDRSLKAHGSHLICAYESARQAITRIAAELSCDAVFTNQDYEPQAIRRDESVGEMLKAHGRVFHTFKDQVVFEKSEVLTAMGKPFTVFTPYKNAWLKKHTAADTAERACDMSQAVNAKQFASFSNNFADYAIPSLAAMGFEKTNLDALGMSGGSAAGQLLLKDFSKRMSRYDETRNFPAIKGPSYLSVHFRFGTISIRQAARTAMQMIDSKTERKEAESNGAQIWLNELIWRDFYHQILFHNPRVVDRAFKPEYDKIQWSNDQSLFEAWCNAKTGYPLIDAAMLQLNTSGYMHNRLRMVVASFLTKDLGIDWRLGEAYFATHLNDFDLAANNGGWQWASSSGCDAQPYFRIFNPTTQSEKFDSEAKFIKRYLPQLAELSSKTIHAPWLAGPIALQAAGVELGGNYPHPIIEHDVARGLTLQRYAVVKKSE